MEEVLANISPGTIHAIFRMFMHAFPCKYEFMNSQSKTLKSAKHDLRHPEGNTANVLGVECFVI